MTSANTSEDLHQGRGWLNRAAEMLDGCEDHVSDAEFAHAAAIIGNGFIALAHAERAAASMAETSQVRQAILTMSDEPETTLVEAVERERRAAAEARPHDEPLPGHMACEFVVRGLRCVLGLNHTPGHHTLQDGSYVDEDGHRLEEIPEADRG